MALVIKGYKAVAVPLPACRRPAAAAGGGEGDQDGADGVSPFTAFIYVRQHSSKGEEDLPAGRTLFLANVPLRPGLDTDAYLREAFGRYGEVEDVRLKQRPAAGPRGQEEDEALAVLHEGGGTRCAIGFLVFRTSKGVKSVMDGGSCLQLAAPSPAALGRKKGGGGKAGRDGEGGHVQLLLKRFRARQPQVRALQAEVDAFMARFEAAEAEEERRRKEAANQPDADGFVTVTYGAKKRRRGGQEAKRGRGGSRGKNKKKKAGELQNFYTHQIREAKREQLARLRARFEEDKARIERMKAARKFKPFG